MKKIVVIGNGKMAVDCLKIMSATPDHIVSLAVTEPRELSPGSGLPAQCRKLGISCLETARLNTPDVVGQVSAIGPDIILNINSFRIIKPALLEIPKDGLVNFHNGPLPRYGGVNVCSWAIINGETLHGVTWHYLDEGIDTGAIIAQRDVEIARDETALSLIMKCINAGTALFRDVFPRLVDGQITARPQDRSKATYYSLRDIPNGGRVDYEWPYDRFDRFIRGLSFHPMPNTFVHPKSACHAKDFFIQRIEKLEGAPVGGECGTVVAVEPDRIAVQIRDSIVGLTEVLDDDRNDVTVAEFAERYRITVGTLLGR